jgi:hypothetical protein
MAHRYKPGHAPWAVVFAAVLLLALWLGGSGPRSVDVPNVSTKPDIEVYPLPPIWVGIDETVKEA